MALIRLYGYGVWGCGLAAGLLSWSCAPQLLDDAALAGATAGVTTTDSTAASCEGGATVFTTHMSARRVIGQADFVATSANRGGAAAANTLSGPIGIAVDNGKIYIADGGNNRVLVYNSIPSTDGAAADAVIGQSNFTSVSAGTSATSVSGIQQIAVANGYLAVAEWTNSRVSFWSLSNPSAIAYAWGQPDLVSATANNGGIGAQSINHAAGLAYGGGKYFMGDSGNNRVLLYDGSVLSNHPSATTVVGQLDMVSSATGSGNTQLGSPYSVTSDGSRLAILDNSNSRVMIYNSIPSSDGAAADVLWGGYGTTATSLANPVGVFLGADGKFFIGDRGNDRVLVFNSLPTSASQVPDAVLGQSDFISGNHNQCNCSTAAANTLWGVHHMYWDGCRLYVADKQNNRVLVY